MGADTQLFRRILVAATVAGVVGAADVGAQTPESPYGGRLAKAVFLSDRVADALGEAASAVPAGSRAMVTEAAARARQLAADAPAGNPAAAARQASRRAIAEGIVALLPSPEARAESAAVAEALLATDAPAVEDAQGIGIPLGRAERAEGYLKAHRESAVAPYLYAYLMVQYRLAFEAQTAAKALDGQKTSAKKYRTFRVRAVAASDPLVKAVAEDIDGQLYLKRAVPEHPRNFDPDACCRDKN